MDTDLDMLTISDTQLTAPTTHPHHVSRTRTASTLSSTERNREYGADLEEIMLMKAIWLSLQEHPLSVCESQKSGSCSNNGLGEFIQRPNETITLTCGTQGQIAQDMPGPVVDACATTATAGEHDKLQPETLAALKHSTRSTCL